MKEKSFPVTAKQIIAAGGWMHPDAQRKLARDFINNALVFGLDLGEHAADLFAIASGTAVGGSVASTASTAPKRRGRPPKVRETIANFDPAKRAGNGSHAPQPTPSMVYMHTPPFDTVVSSSGVDLEPDDVDLGDDDFVEEQEEVSMTNRKYNRTDGDLIEESIREFT